MHASRGVSVPEGPSRPLDPALQLEPIRRERPIVTFWNGEFWRRSVLPQSIFWKPAIAAGPSFFCNPEHP